MKILHCYLCDKTVGNIEKGRFLKSAICICGKCADEQCIINKDEPVTPINQAKQYEMAEEFRRIFELM
jgi:hypothetical protein